MQGRVLAVKPNCPPTLATDFINDAVRAISDRKPNWGGMLDSSIMYLPAPYSTGTVTTVQNSATITGSGTAWAVSDVSNTTLSEAITRIGLRTVAVASMTGITVGSLLMLEAGLANQEVVAVKSVTATSFTAEFTKTHSSGVGVTQSSYAGRQIRIGGRTYPYYTIMGVVSATSLVMDNPWPATAVSAYSYEIRKLYYTLDPAIKMLLSAIDIRSGGPKMRTDVSADWIDKYDPQRSSTGVQPIVLANRGTDANGNNIREIWPATTEERQFPLRFYRQPEFLVQDGDYLPNGINPTLIFMYAAAMALGTKTGASDQADPYYDPVQSVNYMRMFESQYNSAVVAEDAKNNDDFTWGFDNYSMGAQWEQEHLVFKW